MAVFSRCFATLPADLLGLLFARLSARDLLTAACVCRSWRHFSLTSSSSSALWAQHIAQVGNAYSADTVLRASREGRFGRYSLRDVYLIALLPRNDLASFGWTKEDRTLATLIALTQVPRFDVLRHTEPSAANALRLLRLMCLGDMKHVSRIAGSCMRAASWDPCFKCTRGRSFLRLLVAALRFYTLALALACVGLCSVSLQWLPHYVTFNALILPIGHAFHLWQPMLTPQTGKMLRIAVAAGAVMVNACLLFVAGLLTSWRVIITRIAVLICILLMWIVYGPKHKLKVSGIGVIALQVSFLDLAAPIEILRFSCHLCAHWRRLLSEVVEPMLHPAANPLWHPDPSYPAANPLWP